MQKEETLNLQKSLTMSHLLLQVLLAFAIILSLGGNKVTNRYLKFLSCQNQLTKKQLKLFFT